jgi:hypothetical protein
MYVPFDRDTLNYMKNQYKQYFDVQSSEGPSLGH